MFVPYKKYSLNPVPFGFLWYGARYEVYIPIILFGLGFLIRKELTHSDLITFGSLIIVSLIFLIPIWIIYRRSIFNSSDFRNFLKSMGAESIKKEKGFAKGLLVYTISSGMLGNIYIIGIIDSLFDNYLYKPWGPTSMLANLMTAGMRKRQSLSQDSTPGFDPSDAQHLIYGNAWVKGWDSYYLIDSSSIYLFALVSGQFNIDIKIKIDNNEREIPQTGCKEIDNILAESLEYVDHFYARLIFQNWLVMTIIGGACQGRIFEQKINKGFEIFQKLNEVLKNKYSTASWEGWEVKRDKTQEVFYLTSKVSQV